MGDARRRRDGGDAGRGPKIERIEAGDLAYLVRTRERLGTLAQVEAQIEQLQKLHASIMGAHDSYGEFLAEKYRLDPLRDTIDCEAGGAIKRNAGGRVVQMPHAPEAPSDRDPVGDEGDPS